MSYHIRNPMREFQEQKERAHQKERHGQERRDLFIQSQNRISNSEDETGSNDGKKIQMDSVPFDPKQPIVTYSNREPNYPMGYSCQHSLLYSRENDLNQEVADATAVLSHSEDEETSTSKILSSLNQTPVKLSLEFELSPETSDSFESVTSNVEALQWSLLHKVAASSGLSRGCKVRFQYDERSMVTALTNINRMGGHSYTTKQESNDEFEESNDEETPSLPASLPPNTEKTRINHGDVHQGFTSNERGNRRWARALRPNQSPASEHRLLLSTLPYPTTVYDIISNRPKWTASCHSKIIGDNDTTNQCFTAEINFDVTYRGSSGESNLIEEYIQSIIHNQLALDSKQLFAEEITGLRWISEQDATSVFEPPSSDQETLTPIFFGPDFFGPDPDSAVDNISASIEEGSSNDLFAIIMIPLATAIILLSVWFFTHRHHKKRYKKNKQEPKQEHKQESLTGVTKTPVKERDVETGSDVTAATPEIESKSSMGSQDSADVKSCTKMIIKAVGLSSAASSALIETLSPRKKSRPISVDSPERTAAGLPPRPMMVKREVSKQLKKTRKKKRKKNKKVNALTRIKSRDNIVEMPIISESESEHDSQYSSGDEEYSNDGSSYNASDGCLTPSRSQSPSRASSPQQSPRDDSNPTNAAPSSKSPDFEFVMEAPELSKDLLVVEANKQKIVGVDENLPPNVTRTMSLDPDGAKPRTVSAEKPRIKRHMEIDTRSDKDSSLNNSFSEENGSIMERMLPMPWLGKKKTVNPNHKSNLLR